MARRLLAPPDQDAAKAVEPGVCALLHAKQVATSGNLVTFTPYRDSMTVSRPISRVIGDAGAARGLGCGASARGAVSPGDPLEELSTRIGFETFRPVLDEAMGSRDAAKGGRPPFDPALKFRILVLHALHGLSLKQTEYLVWDRPSRMRFCGLRPDDAAPDANTH